MKHLSQFILVIFLIFQFSALSSCEKTEPQPQPEPEIVLTGILKTLQKEHPRLLLTETRLQELKTLSNTDTKLEKIRCRCGGPGR